jgi:hypothetical protein
MIKAAGFRYIPKGAIKVADKKSDAVAYLYMGGEAARYGGEPIPCARVFFGKQSKPVLAMQFKNAADRAKRVGEYFASRQAWIAAKAAEAAKRKATGRGVEVGQFLASSWGYDQTNVNFYKVVKLIGTTMAEVVAVGNNDVGGGGSGSMSSTVIPCEEPAPDAKAYKVVVKAGRATINGNYASLWDGLPKFTSWYA